jgi:putative tryptophan/tyrosine transport system substrate-binding protein
LSARTSGKIYEQITLFWLMVTGVLITALPTDAQQAAKVPRIGYLLAAGSAETARRDAFRQGLRELGYVEGKNIIIEWRAAEGKLDRLDELAAELVRLKVDVFVTSGNSVVRAAKRATSTIPIVTALVSDPVENGFVASLARPGGNSTGLTSLGAELSGKRMELLKEVVPGLSRLMMFVSSSSPGNSQTMHQTETVAKAMGVQITYKDIQGVDDIEAAFKAAGKSRPDAVLMLPNAVLLLHRKRVVELAAQTRVPMMYNDRESFKSGALSPTQRML